MGRPPRAAHQLNPPAPRAPKPSSAHDSCQVKSRTQVLVKGGRSTSWNPIGTSSPPSCIAAVAAATWLGPRTVTAGHARALDPPDLVVLAQPPRPWTAHIGVRARGLQVRAVAALREAAALAPEEAEPLAHALGAWTAAGCPRRWSGHHPRLRHRELPGRVPAALPRTDRPCGASGCPRLACAPASPSRRPFSKRMGSERALGPSPQPVRREGRFLGSEGPDGEPRTQVGPPPRFPGDLPHLRRQGRDIAHHARLLGEDRRYAHARPVWTNGPAFLSAIAPRPHRAPTYVDKVSEIPLRRTRSLGCARRRCRCQGRRHRLQPLAGPRAAAHGRRHHRRRRLREVASEAGSTGTRGNLSIAV